MAKKSKVNVCALVELLMVIIGIIYVIVCTVKGIHTQWIYRIIFAIGVVIYIVIDNFLEPVVMNKFRRKHKKQVRAYYKYAILDSIGLLGLLWFVVMAGMFEDYTHYAGIAIFAVCYVPKQTFYNKYNMRSSYFVDLDEEDDDDDGFDIEI